MIVHFFMPRTDPGWKMLLLAGTSTLWPRGWNLAITYTEFFQFLRDFACFDSAAGMEKARKNLQTINDTS